MIYIGVILVTSKEKESAYEHLLLLVAKQKMKIGDGAKVTEAVSNPKPV